MKYIKKIVYSTIITVFAVLIPVNVYSMETVYVNNPEIWYSDSRIINASEKNTENFSGIFSYYADTDNACFYLHISYNEKNLKDKENEIKVEFNITNEINKYNFIVDENGIIDADREIRKVFDTACNFGEATKQGQEIYLGIEFKGKADKTLDNDISFSVIVNGKTYVLANGIDFSMFKEEETKVKVSNESNSGNSAKKDRTSTKNSTAKSTTEKVTKFKYTGPNKSHNTYDETYKYNEDNIASEGNIIETASKSIEIITEEENKSSTLSQSSKILIAVAVISILTGVSLIAYHSIKSKKINNKSSENQSEDI